MIAAITLAIGLPLVIWLPLAILLHGRTFEMDAHVRYSFYAVLALYRRLSSMIFGVSGVLALLGALYVHGGGADAYIMLLTTATVYALLFQVWLTWCYEGYLHQRYAPPVEGTNPYEANYSPNSPYTGTRYAVTVALGVSALFLFCAGFVGIVAVLVGR